MKRLLAACVFLLMSTGCLKTYVKRSASLNPDSPLPTLMVHTGVSVEQTSDPDNPDGGTVIEVVQNTMLDTFGETILDSSTAFLEAQGVTLTLDPERAKSHQKVDLGQLGNHLSILTGAWTDPRGSVMPIQPSTLFRGAFYAKMSEHFYVQGSEAEGYLYVVGRIHHRGLLRPYPKLSLTFVVHNHEGKELLIAQGVGKGKRRPVILDRSPRNLGLALEQAVSELDSATVEALD